MESWVLVGVAENFGLRMMGGAVGRFGWWWVVFVVVRVLIRILSLYR
eukprot:gene2512-4884_t